MRSRRRKLERFSESELEELLHAPATSGLRNVLSFGRHLPSDVSSPGDKTSPVAAAGDPGDVSSSGASVSSATSTAHLFSGALNFPAPPHALEQPPSGDDVSTPGDKTSPGRRPVRISRQRTLDLPALQFRTAAGEVVDPKRVQRAILVQHGHSSSEQLVYQLLYGAGSANASHPTWRDVQIGYDKLSHMTGITKRNIIPLMHRLQQKLAIEIVEYQDSAKNIARKYRVFNMAEVLERRRAAKFDYVIRHRGVEFVFPDGNSGPDDVSSPGDISSSGHQTSPGDNRTPRPGDVSTPAPGDKTSPLLGSSFRKFLGTSSSPGSAPAAIASAILSAMGFVDDEALCILAEKCRAIVPDATDDEIAELGGMTARRIARLRNIDNPTGLLISQTAKCFVGEPFQMYRRENAERQQRFAALCGVEDGTHT